jgi:ELWxxDGT repeat protein
VEDGRTAAGTSEVDPDNVASGLANVGGTLYFSGDYNVLCCYLFRSDGTPGGTAIVSDEIYGGGNIADVNGTAFFTGTDDGSDGPLYVLPPGGTPVPVANKQFSFAEYLTAVGSTLFFMASDGQGTALWKSDGTDAGTFELANVPPPDRNVTHRWLVAAGNTLYFAGNDGVHGTELWKSDGTVAGTTMFADINPGSASSITAPELTPIGDDVYFAANDGAHGSKLWRSGPSGTASRSRTWRRRSRRSSRT